VIRKFVLTMALATVLLPAAASAQDEQVEQEPPANPETDEDWRGWMPDPASLEMPQLDFEPSGNDERNYKKYYYFSRAETSFEEAFNDIRYCDALARGLSVQAYSADPTMAGMYGIGGVIGGVLGSMLADAIYGSAEARAKRRVNMRRCMRFKGYARHGLAKDLWQEFNFEEGNSSVEEEARQRMLAVQALVASSDAIEAEDIGL